VLKICLHTFIACVVRVLVVMEQNNGSGQTCGLTLCI